MFYQPNSVLITGGAGFIGANFIRYVLKNESCVSIVNLDKLTYAGSLQNLDSLSETNRYHFIKGDIRDEKLVENTLQFFNIDTIVHFAAESHVDRSINQPHNFIETNIIGTFILLEASRKYNLKRFHHISTDEVYGSLKNDGSLFTENNSYRPRSPYSASKASADHLVNCYFHTYNLPITISNCSNNYGPYQHREKFIPKIIYSCLNKQPIPVYGNGKNIRDWLHVEDHCQAIMTVIKKGKVGENYNIGGNNEWENIKLAHYICSQMDELFPWERNYASLISHVTDRPGHDFRYAIDSTKMQTELVWAPKINFAGGIRETIQFYFNKKF